jgi:hypothetical protein
MALSKFDVIMDDDEGRKAQKLYDEWIDNIVKDSRTNINELLEHIIHHTKEGLEQNVCKSWLASMENLLEIIRRFTNNKVPINVETKLERLYLHWKADPTNTVAPPQLESLNKTIELASHKQQQKKKKKKRQPKPRFYMPKPKKRKQPEPQHDYGFSGS